MRADERHLATRTASLLARWPNGSDGSRFRSSLRSLQEPMDRTLSLPASCEASLTEPMNRVVFTDIISTVCLVWLAGVGGLFYSLVHS
ncbi:hypothetical protein EDF70_10941 [Neorhizobium sp. JUb45]|nr:hypothetical protein EDF70_10941 [Neorhizobium sp. JUb45]